MANNQRIKIEMLKPSVIILLGLAVILVLLLLLVNGILWINASKGYSFLYKTIDYNMLMSYIVPIVFNFISVAFIIALKIKKRYKIVLAIFTLFISFVLFAMIDDWTSHHYHYFQSPDMQTTVVIHESGWLWTGNIGCYVQDNVFFIKRLNGGIDKGIGDESNFILSWIDNEKFFISYNGKKIHVNVNDVLPNNAPSTNFIRVK